MNQHNDDYYLQQKLADLEEQIERAEVQIVRLEIENNELKRALKTHQFDQYKLKELQKISQSGNWEFNHINGSFKLSTSLADMLEHDEPDTCELSKAEFFQLFQQENQLSLLEEFNEKVVKNDEVLVTSCLIKSFKGNLLHVKHHLKTFYNAIGQPMISVGLIANDTAEHNYFKKLKHLSRIDELTGLYNRRYINKTIMQQHAVHKRNQQPISFILIDLDNFKSINDKYSHATGDDVLRAVSAVLRNQVRETDFVGRWGGEEFLVICPNTVLAGAKKLASKLRVHIAQIRQANLPEVTASFGISEAQPEDQYEYILNQADKALYKAKDDGRNCVR